jgi:hypothetical protein
MSTPDGGDDFVGIGVQVKGPPKKQFRTILTNFTCEILTAIYLKNNDIFFRRPAKKQKIHSRGP